MKKYKILNEVLIEWNESSKEDSDNTFLKSEDIKESLDRCFIYKRTHAKNQIRIFDEDWPEYEKYKNKVWINNQQIELKNNGWTVDYFELGEYRVYIKNIDKLTNTYSMFYNCTRLISAFIPNSVASIGRWAFYGCERLTSVDIPNSVTYIGENAFDGCESLTSVAIPSFVTSIGGYAFNGCSSLTSMTIPNSVTSIGSWAFKGCDSLKTVYVEDINKFNQIKFKDKTANPRYYGAKLIELKK